MRINRNQAGDTLVEVMLAIAVIGMVIGASYATASRALRTGRFAQEQTEALKLAESQVEQLKYLASTSVLPGSANDIFNGAAGQNRFCIRDNDSFTKVLATSSADYTSYCRLRSGLYNILVEYTGSENLFRINIDWERTGATNGAVQVSYKLYR